MLSYFKVPRLISFIFVILNVASAYTNGMTFSTQNNVQVRNRRQQPQAAGSTQQVRPSSRRAGVTLYAQEGEGSSKHKANYLSLVSRPHERGIFAFYALVGMAVSTLTEKQGLFQVGIAIMWASFVLAISFMEAWVKFKAPFLNKYVAVDVGRHVFAALQSAELGMCTALWFSCTRLLASGFKWRPRFSALTIATACLVGEALFVAPRLYLRAKARIVEGFQSLPPDVKDGLLSKEQEKELDKVSRDVDERKDSMPSKKWHSAYGVLELVKVVALVFFAVASWFELFCDVLVHYAPKGW